jgi:hypothetical protein
MTNKVRLTGDLAGDHYPSETYGQAARLNQEADGRLSAPPPV